MRPAPALLAALLSCQLSPLSRAADLAGPVVAVHDGDTLTVLVERARVKVRLKDIDAPELGQPFGPNARQSLAELCFGRPAELEIRGRDRYRRTVARVTCAGTDANAAQVRRGYAWTYARFAPRGSPLYSLEQEARAARRGLWSDSAPVAPWDWRNHTLSRGRRPDLVLGQ